MMRSEVPARPDPATYSPIQKRLHWAVVILIALQYLVFDGMGRYFRAVVREGVHTYGLVSVAHIAIGLSVAALMVWRLVLRRRDGVPETPGEEPELARKVAKFTHAAFYALIFAMAALGVTGWFFAVGTAGELHELCTSLLLALIALHVGAVLVHQFWWKTGLLARMT